MGNKTMRNSKVELLRIVAMFFIVLSHSSVHGGFNTASMEFSFNKIFLEVSVLGNLGVDIFMLISGYFLCTKERNVKGIIKLVLQVFFYSVFCFIIAKYCFGQSFTLDEIKSVLSPTVYQRYWFFTAYIVILLLSPYINRIFVGLSRKEFRIFLLIMLVIWSIIPTFKRQPMYGNEIIQLFMLYCIGAYFRNFPQNIFQKTVIKCGVLIGSATVLILSTVFFEYMKHRDSGYPKYGNYYYDRNSIFIIGVAVGLFVFFVYSRPFTSKFINTVSGCMFGVYLFHDNFKMRSILWLNIFNNVSFVNSLQLPLRIAASVFSVFTVGVIIEFIRQKLVEAPLMLLVDKLLLLIKKFRQKYLLKEVSFISVKSESREEIQA